METNNGTKMTAYPSIGAYKNALCGVADSVAKKKNGNIIIRRGYFYRHGMDSDKFVGAIANRLKAAGIEAAATLIDYGDHYTTFKGGASLARSSHFWVELKPRRE